MNCVATNSTLKRLFIILISVAALLIYVNRFGIGNEGDTFWLIRVGKDILLSHTFPKVDIYSHTLKGQPWLAKEWLSSVILALAFNWAGFKGVAIAVVLAYSLTLYLLASHITRLMDNSFAFVLAFFTGTLLITFLSGRAQLLLLPVCLLYIIELTNAVGERRAPSFWAIILLVLWANLHASYPFAVCTTGVFFIDYLYRNRLSLQSQVIKKWVLFSLASFFAVVLTPYGFTLYRVSLETMLHQNALLYIEEWRPLWAFTGMFWLCTIFFGLMLFSLSFDARKNAVRIGLVCLLYAMCLKHARFLYFLLLFGTTLIPYHFSKCSVYQIKAVFPKSWIAIWDSFPRENFIIPEALSRRVYKVAISVVAVVLCVNATILVFRAPPNYPVPEVYPTQFLPAIDKLNGLGNGFNAYNLGGFLIANHIPTFIDGRLDQLYDRGFAQQIYFKLFDTHEDVFSSIMKTYNVKWLLLDNSFSLSHAAFDKELDNSPRWVLVMKKCLLADAVNKYYHWVRLYAWNEPKILQAVSAEIRDHALDHMVGIKCAMDAKS